MSIVLFAVADYHHMEEMSVSIVYIVTVNHEYCTVCCCRLPSYGRDACVYCIYCDCKPWVLYCLLLQITIIWKRCLCLLYILWLNHEYCTVCCCRLPSYGRDVCVYCIYCDCKPWVLYCLLLQITIIWKRCLCLLYILWLNHEYCTVCCCRLPSYGRDACVYCIYCDCKPWVLYCLLLQITIIWKRCLCLLYILWL